MPALQDAYGAIQEAASSALQSGGLRDVGSVALTGAGMGMGLRGLLGLLSLARRNIVKPQTSVPAPTEIDIPAEVEEEKKADALGFLKGDDASSKSGMPWYIPALLGGGALGAAGGYKGMDWLLDRRRKKEIDDQLADAKAEYEQALSEATGGRKLAADASLTRDLDTIFDAVEKQGMEKEATFADSAGKATGIYGLYGLSSALAAAVATYSWGKKRRRKEILEKARKKRLRDRYRRQPSSILASSVPATNSEDPLAKEDPLKPAPSLDSQENELEL
jgi:hypothetical protein